MGNNSFGLKNCKFAILHTVNGLKGSSADLLKSFVLIYYD